MRSEKDQRVSWCERFDKETRALSQLNVEMMEVRARCQEFENRVKHLEVEVKNERQMSASLIVSKKELMNTVNTYVVKCEIQESDLYAMKEVNKHFEALKEIQFKELKESVRHLKGYINQVEMNVEEYYTRLGYYSDTIMKQRSSILRVALELTFSKRLCVELKDKFADKLEYIDTLEEKQRKQDDEIIVSRNSYKIMKSRIQNKDDELAGVQKELEELNAKYEIMREKKKQLKIVKDDLDDQLRSILDVRSQM